MTSRGIRWILLGGGVVLAVGAWAVLRGGKPTATPGAAPSNSIESYYQSGEKNRAAGQVTAAVVDYNRALAVDPRDGRAYIGLAVLYESLGRADLAVDAMEQLRAANPEAEHLYCRLAEAYLGSEDTREALKLGEVAARREPNCARALSVYGIAAARHRYWDTAATALEGAWKLAPEDTGIPTTLIEVYLQRTQYQKVIDTARAQLGSDPNSARLTYKLGFAQARLPQTPEVTAEAERTLRHAAELDPNWFEPHAELGRLYSSLGRPKEAAISFQQALKLGPNVPGVAFNLARAWRQLHDPRAPEMESRFRKLMAAGTRFTHLRASYNSDPNDPKAALVLAENEGNAGLYGAALHRLRKVLARDPGDVRAVSLFLRLDRASRQNQPQWLRPGPGIAPVRL